MGAKAIITNMKFISNAFNDDDCGIIDGYPLPSAPSTLSKGAARRKQKTAIIIAERTKDNE